MGEIHSVAEVPRSAVYGTLEKLELRGIIETSTGRPKKFRALPPKIAVAKIESELTSAVRDVRCGLEELANAPHREASDVRIWVLKGVTRVRERLEDIVGSARTEFLVAGTPELILAFSDVWKTARSKNVKAIFASQDPDEISELSRYGEIQRPATDMMMHEISPPKVLFVRVDRRTILFASEYEDESRVKGLTAFWTEDASIVRFLNYLTESLSPHSRKGRNPPKPKG